MKPFYILISRLILSLILFYFSLYSFAQGPNLRTAGNFVLFTSAGAIDNTGISEIIGKIGTHAGAITGFVPLAGQQEIANSITAQASIDLAAGYNELLSAVTTFPSHGAIFGNGEVLTPGVYNIASAASIDGTLYLDALGDPNAIFIFKILGALTSSASSKVLLSGGAVPFNIFWGTEGGAISFATLSEMKGNFIANPGAVSSGDGCIIEGRMLSTSGAISVYATKASAIPFTILSSSLKDFHANAGDNAVDVSWTSSNESSLASYDLEKSADGHLFARIGHVAATNTSSVKTYHWRDNKLTSGLSFYRLKMLDKDKAFKYSAIIPIEISSGKSMTIYPNPVSGHIMKVQMVNQLNGNYDVSIYTLKSEKIVSTQLKHNGSDGSYNIQLRKNIRAGNYFVKITDQQSHEKTFKILVE
ncbi:MAG TPA: ice-binding family protein [Flavitalea sp.]|nr:ice-binding family protein [Flavitalea sp.]